MFWGEVPLFPDPNNPTLCQRPSHIPDSSVYTDLFSHQFPCKLLGHPVRNRNILQADKAFVYHLLGVDIGRVDFRRAYEFDLFSGVQYSRL